MTSTLLLERAQDGVVGEPDPAARPRRRTFTAEYKAALLDEYDASLCVGVDETAHAEGWPRRDSDPVPEPRRFETVQIIIT